MKSFTSIKMLLSCLCLFLTIGYGSLLWAQPMEEEEEELQPRPNPMEMTTKPNMALENQNIGGKGTVMSRGQGSMGKGLGVFEGVGSVKHGSASVSGSKGQLGKKLSGMEGETPNPMKNQGVMGLGKGLGAVGGVGSLKQGSSSASMGEGTLKTGGGGLIPPADPMLGQMGGKAAMSPTGDDTPTNPVSPVTSGAASPGVGNTNDSPTNPVNLPAVQKTQ